MLFDGGLVSRGRALSAILILLPMFKTGDGTAEELGRGFRGRLREGNGRPGDLVFSRFDEPGRTDAVRSRRSAAEAIKIDADAGVIYVRALSRRSGLDCLPSPRAVVDVLPNSRSMPECEISQR